MPIAIIECRDAEHFLAQLDPAEEKWGDGYFDGVCIFRGQADVDWPLLPSALRSKLNSPRDILTNRELAEKAISKLHIEHYRGLLPSLRDNPFLADFLYQVQAEENTLLAFSREIDRLGLADTVTSPVFEKRAGDWFVQRYVKEHTDPAFVFKTWGNSTVAIAQHHGLSTRLLDWTRNPWYAAFFAGDNPVFYQSGLSNKPDKIAVYAVLQNVFENRTHSIKLVEVSATYSPNIAHQQGLFTLDTTADSHFFETGNWRCLTETDLAHSMIKLTLESKHVPELMRILTRRDITKAALFATRDSVVQSLKDKWERIKFQKNS